MFEVAFGLLAGMILGWAYKTFSVDKFPVEGGGVVARMGDWLADSVEDIDATVLVTRSDMQLLNMTVKNFQETVNELATRVVQADTAAEAANAQLAILSAKEVVRQAFSTSVVSVPGVTLKAVHSEPAVPAAPAKAAKPAKPKAAKAAKGAKVAPAKARKR